MYFGIDPGRHGALAWFAEEQPAMGATAVDWSDPGAAVKAFRGLCHAGDVVAVERNHAIPGMGAASAFTFGRSFGILLGVLAAIGVEPVIVRAQDWRAWALGGKAKVPKDRKGREAATVAAAMARWPELKWPKTKRAREAVACAAFIGEFAHSGRVEAK